jgi:hypothetical protein
MEEFLYMIEELYTGNSNIEILEESQSSIKSQRKGSGLKYRAVLQEADSINGNNRTYLASALKEGIEKVQDKARKRQLYGELDHPITDNPARFTTVKLKDAAFVIENLYWEGKTLKNEARTLSNGHGRDMRAFIEEDNLPLGFSLRALGKTTKKGMITEVSSPLTVVTFDCVSNPSHKNALIETPLTESSVKEMLLDKSERIKIMSEADNIKYELLTESSNLNYNPDSNLIQICNGDRCISFFLEHHIREKYKKTLINSIKK